MHLRLVVPDRCRDDVLGLLVNHPGVTNVVRLPGAALSPAGDLVLADVTREVGTSVLRDLDALGIREDGSIAIDDADTVLSNSAIQAERDSPGAPGDAVVWQAVVAQVEQDVAPSWSFHVFLIMATIIAGIAVVLDSPILVIGAMVVSPDFSPVAAASVGLVRRRWGLVRRALATARVGIRVGDSGDHAAGPHRPCRGLDHRRGHRGTTAADCLHLDARPLVVRRRPDRRQHRRAVTGVGTLVRTGRVSSSP